MSLIGVRVLGWVRLSVRLSGVLHIKCNSLSVFTSRVTTPLSAISASSFFVLFLREELLLRIASHGRVLTATTTLHFSLLSRKSLCCFSLLFRKTCVASDHLTQDPLPPPVLRKTKPFDWNHCRSCILLVVPLFGCPLIC
jgi:hypothetical protein